MRRDLLQYIVGGILVGCIGIIMYASVFVGTLGMEPRTVMKEVSFAVLTGAAGGLLAASFIVVVHYTREKALAKRELREVCEAISEWEPLPDFDGQDTDDIQYKAFCESLMHVLSGSHIEHSKKMYLWHNLKVEVALIDAGVKPKEYFTCFVFNDNGELCELRPS